MRRYFTVIVDNKVKNTTAVDKDTVEESLTFLNTHFKVDNGTWKYLDNTLPQNKYSSVNDNYNSEEDYFYHNKPSNNWTYNKSKYRWEPNVPYPDGGEWDDNDINSTYYWDEETVSWIEKT
tara:strand:+ start:827 stop:1189 length:363 start_codon:yes stop_codon:yes gene_type:complete